jgi:hypothetical protein
MSRALLGRSAAPLLLLSLLACGGGGGGGTGGGAGGGGGSGAVPDVARCTLAAEQASAVADNTEGVKLTVTVLDRGGAPVRGARVRLAATGQGNNLPEPPNTDDTGSTFTVLHSSRAEVKTVSAEVEVNGTFTALPSTVDVTFVAGPGDSFEFVTQPTTTKAGVAIAPAVTLELKDRNGNRATDAGSLNVSLRLVRSSGGTVSGGAARAPVGGVFTFDALVINRPQTGYALRAEGSNGSAAESQLFDVTLGDFSAATSTFVAAPVNVVADGSATTTLTFTARDTGGNALPGQTVGVSVTGTGNTLAAASGTTDAAGVFTTTLASSVPEAKTVTATVGTETLTAVVTFIP